MPTKTLMLNLSDITTGQPIGTPESQIGGSLTVEYDREVNTTTERVPQGLMENVPLSGETLSVPVLCADGADIEPESQGFRVIVRADLFNRTRPEVAKRTYIWKVSVTTESPDPVYLSKLKNTDPVPPQYVDILALIQDIKDNGLKGDPGHTPVLGWSGDQITVDGVATGPHLTGPGATDDVVEGFIADDNSVTRGTLEELFVPTADLVPVPTVLPGYHQERLVVPPGPVSVVLGGDPLPGSLMVISGGQAVNPNLSGRNLTFYAVGHDNLIYYAYDANGPEPSPVGSPLVIADTFTRANSTTTLGRAETGQVWTVPKNAAGNQPVWGIKDNAAYVVDSGGNDSYAYIDAGVADCVVEVQYSAYSTGSAGLYVRATDASNGYTSNTLGLYQRVGGSNSNTQGWHILYSSPFTAGDTARLVCSGTHIEMFQDKGSTGTFVSVGSAEDDMYTGNTKHGFREGAGQDTTTFDNFHIYGR